MTKSGAILPLAVLSGAAVGTVAVWRSSDNQSRNSLLSTNSIKILEQRVANLETICNNQELDLQRKIEQLEAKDQLNHLFRSSSAQLHLFDESYLIFINQLKTLAYKA